MGGDLPSRSNLAAPEARSPAAWKPPFFLSADKVASNAEVANTIPRNRAVVQLGRTLEWGSRGRGFKSRRPEVKNLTGMFHVYVLRSMKTGRYYVGSCQDLDDRIRRHNAGHSKATRHGIPWFLVKKESFSTRTEAVRRERYFKTGRVRDELAVLNL